MSKLDSIQESFLNSLRKAHTPVYVYLGNGKKLQGEIDAFDNFVIILKVHDRKQMVYKHVISTISPLDPDVDGHDSAQKPAPDLSG